MFRFLDKLGKMVLNFLEEFGEVSLLFLKIHSHLNRVYRDRRLILRQMEHIGVDSIPLVIVIAIFTGAVSAWQAAYQ